MRVECNDRSVSVAQSGHDIGATRRDRCYLDGPTHVAKQLGEIVDRFDFAPRRVLGIKRNKPFETLDRARAIGRGGLSNLARGRCHG